MSHKNKRIKVATSSIIILILLVGTIFNGMIVFGENGFFGEESTIVLAYADNEDEVRELSEYGEIIDHYGRNVLIEISEDHVEKLKAEYEINTLDHRNELLLRGYEFDTSRGLPEVNYDMKIDDYEPGTEGLYLVDMIGPVNPEWREILEGKGIDILNYIPNYAYLVRMRPEQADRVEDLFFVDWVGIYQPEFKLAENVEPGLVSVTFSNGMRSIMEVSGEDQLVEIANRNDVCRINQYFEPKLYDEMATQTVGGGLWIWDPEDDPDSAYRGHGDYGSLATQLGHDGSGVVVAVADSGLGDGTIGDAGHPDFDGRVIGGYDYESESFDEGEWNDLNSHGTHVAGSVAGHTHGGKGETVYEDYYAAEGTAPGSELFAVKIFDEDGEWIGGSDYYEIVEIPKQAEENTYIHTNSWGADTGGEYTDSDEDFDRAVRDANSDTDENEPMIITVAAGNEGSDENSISSPGNAKNVITVGSTGNHPHNSPEAVSSFSSRGWTDDNRVKPDVMAPGELIYSTEPDESYGYKSGTSMATPAVAGAAASVVDWYESTYGAKPTPSMVRALLINTAYDLANEQNEMGENSPYIPNQDEGWGMVNLPNIVHTDVNMMLENEDSLIQTGDVHEYEIEQDDSTEPLRITLTWTDAVEDDGLGPFSEKVLNNDLNLEVESPSGEIYRGNNLVESWSVPGEHTYDAFDSNDDGWDDVNNVQNVYLLPDDVEEGTYTVRVIGNNVPEDANNDGDANQDYSLVKWNAVESEPGPLSPSDPEPSDGATGVPTDVELSVYVEHEEGETMDVSFYDDSDDSLIGQDNDVQSGDRAYVSWEGLESGTKYNWYAVADDSTKIATSDTWSFTTEGENYTLTLDSTEGGEVVEPGEGTFEYHEGTVVELEAVADDGYEFVEWTGDVGTIDDIGSATTTIEMLDDYIVTAEFAEITYILEVSSTVGGEVLEPGEGTFEYQEGTIVDLEAVADDGYEFVEWTGDVGTVEDTGSGATTIEMLDDYAITAEFAEITYILEVSSTVGGEVVEPGEGTFEYQEGTIVDLEAVADDGYEFVEWTGDVETIDDTGSATTTIEMLDDYAITAEFAEITYILEVSSTVGGEVLEPGEGTFEYQEGTIVDLEAVSEDGYEFVEWTGDVGTVEDTGSGATTIEMLDDYDITAEFIEEYDLTINIDGEGTTDPAEGTQTYEEGTEVTIEAISADGWEFVEWTGDETGTDEEIKVTMDNDKEITAVFEEVVEYDLKINIEGEGATDPAEGTHTYEEGTEVTIEAISADGWEFVEWIGDETGTDPTIQIIMDNDKEITAHFEELEEYDLTINIKGEGATEPEEGTHTYEEGTEVTVEATPEEDWEFVEWRGDNDTMEYTTANQTMITMGDDYTITAVFEEELPEEYDLTIYIEGEGTTDPEEGTHTYEEGTEVTVEATAVEDCEFVEWTGDETGTDTTINITMDSDKSITAVFEEEPEPAYFEVEVIDYDDEVEEGVTVTAEYTVENTGELEDTQDIIFSVDGTEKEVEAEVTLGAGEEFTGEFTWEAEDEGEYELEVASEDDEDTVSVTVEQEAPGFTMILFVLGLVLAVALYYKIKQ